MTIVAVESLEYIGGVSCKIETKSLKKSLTWSSLANFLSFLIKIYAKYKAGGSGKIIKRIKQKSEKISSEGHSGS